MSDDTTVPAPAPTTPSRFFSPNLQPKPKYKKRFKVRKRIEPNIWRVDNRFEAHVTVNGKKYMRFFPLGVSLVTIRTWLTHTVATNRLPHEPAYRHPAVPSLKGWCYLYFVRQGDAVKIGRANDVKRRLEELQTASAMPLTLLVAVAAHASLEAEYLKRLEPYRLSGEWFVLGAEIQRLIDMLKQGQNPVELLFLWDQILVP